MKFIVAILDDEWETFVSQDEDVALPGEERAKKFPTIELAHSCQMRWIREGHVALVRAIQT